MNIYTQIETPRSSLNLVDVDWNLRLYIVLIGAANRTGLFGVSGQQWTTISDRRSVNNSSIFASASIFWLIVFSRPSVMTNVIEESYNAVLQPLQASV